MLSAKELADDDTEVWLFRMPLDVSRDRMLVCKSEGPPSCVAWRVCGVPPPCHTQQAFAATVADGLTPSHPHTSPHEPTTNPPV